MLLHHHSGCCIHISNICLLKPCFVYIQYNHYVYIRNATHWSHTFSRRYFPIFSVADELASRHSALIHTQRFTQQTSHYAYYYICIWRPFVHCRLLLYKYTRQCYALVEWNAWKVMFFTVKICIRFGNVNMRIFMKIYIQYISVSFIVHINHCFFNRTNSTNGNGINERIYFWGKKIYNTQK